MILRPTDEEMRRLFAASARCRARPVQRSDYRYDYDRKQQRTYAVGGGAAAFDFRNKLGVIGGQSNSVGQGNTTNIDNGLGATTLLSSAQLAMRYSQSTSDPLVLTDVPATPPPYFRDLQPWAAPGGPGMGPELSMIRYLLDAGAIDTTTHWGKFGVSGSDISKWLPGSGYPTSGGVELFTLLTNYLDALIAASGKQLGIFVWIQGESDCDSDAEASAYQSRLTTFIAALRARYGNDFLFVISRINENQIGGLSGAMTTARVHTVQAAQDAVAAASPSNVICINTDRAPVNATQLEHYLADGYWILGNILGSGIAQKVAPARNDNQGSGAAPWMQWFRQPSTGNDSSNGNISVHPTTESKNADIEVLCVMHASSTTQDIAPALVTAAGFVQQGSAARTVFSTNTIVYLSVFTRTSDGSTPLPPVVQDLVTRKRAWIFSVRNTAGLDVTPVVTNLTTNSTSATLNGATTVTNNCRVFFIAAYFSGSTANTTAFTAGGLSNVVIHRNTYVNNNGQNACKFAVMSGTLATAGGSGTAALTLANASVTAGMCMAFKPAA